MLLFCKHTTYTLASIQPQKTALGTPFAQNEKCLNQSGIAARLSSVLSARRQKNCKLYVAIILPFSIACSGLNKNGSMRAQNLTRLDEEKAKMKKSANRCNYEKLTLRLSVLENPVTVSKLCFV